VTANQIVIAVGLTLYETLVPLIIGVLFISISATVTPQSLRYLLLLMLALVAALVVLVGRPPLRSRPR
jgi:membrane protein implicated in regulation of membrane protease activity